MTDTPPTDIEATGPPADSWRRLALDMAELFDGDDDPLYVEFPERRDALLAAEDPHPPVFHVRPVWVHKRGSMHDHRVAGRPNYTKQWRWGAREANGEIVIPESEPLTHKAHAVAMAHRFADSLGAEVRVADEEGA